MSDEEQGLSMLNTNREIDTLTRQLACLHSRKQMYVDKIEYILDAMNDSLSDEGVDSGAHYHPDVKEWPSADDVRKLFADIYDTSERLKKAQHLFKQF